MEGFLAWTSKYKYVFMGLIGIMVVMLQLWKNHSYDFQEILTNPTAVFSLCNR